MKKKNLFRFDLLTKMLSQIKQSKALFAGYMLIAILYVQVPIDCQLHAQTTSDYWTFYSEVSNVKVYYHISDCNLNKQAPVDASLPVVIETPKSSLLLKFENGNSSVAQVTWNSELVAKADNARSATMVNASGVALIDCEKAPLITLSEMPDDKKPIALMDAIELLSISVVLK